AIRKQHVTNLFYVPAGSGLEVDHVVLLDDVHTMPAEVFATERGTKIFTLSQAGFYLFIIKLSLHFCRFHEALIRAYPEPRFRDPLNVRVRSSRLLFGGA